MTDTYVSTASGLYVPTAAQGERAALRKVLKPNAPRRAAYWFAWQGFPCSTCLLAIVRDGKNGADRRPWSGQMGHRVDILTCRSFSTEYVGPQCWACNWDANAAGIWDQTEGWACPPYSLPSQKVANAWRAATPYVDGDGLGLPDWSARRAARAARGLSW